MANRTLTQEERETLTLALSIAIHDWERHMREILPSAQAQWRRNIACARVMHKDVMLCDAIEIVWTVPHA